MNNYFKGIKMKKFIILTGIIVLIGIGIFAAVRYAENYKLSAQETYTNRFMQNKFAPFVATWDVESVPLLFIENAEVNNIAKILNRIKESVGVCKMRKIGSCQSQERVKETKPDVYYTLNGYSVRCTFNMSCEHEENVTGETVFFPDGLKTKLYSFTITYGEEE